MASAMTDVPAADNNVRDLYGGALHASVPARFDDVSQFRQVPDHQEVFADAGSDQSVIVEINQYEREWTHATAPARFFAELAESNKATSHTVGAHGLLYVRDADAGVIGAADATSTTPPPDLLLTALAPAIATGRVAAVGYCSGEQIVHKFNEREKGEVAGGNTVHIWLCNLRLCDQPAGGAAGDYDSDILVIFSVPVAFDDKSSSAGKAVLSAEANVAVVREVLSTFSIDDWALFTPGKQ